MSVTTLLASLKSLCMPRPKKDTLAVSCGDCRKVQSCGQPPDAYCEERLMQQCLQAQHWTRPVWREPAPF